MLFNNNIKAQSWKYKSGGSDFDGKYKTSYVIGVGNEFPYESPLMAINKFDKKDGFNFYISGAGYSQEGTGLKVLWVFSNEPDTIYSTYDFSISSDGKIIFFNEFNDPNSEDKISSAEFINKLKSASKVSVRVKDNYSSNDLVFSLKGSTKAINFVLPDLDNIISDVINKKKAVNEIKQQKTAKIDELINSIKYVKLSSSSLSTLIGKLKEDFGLDPYGLSDTNKNYKSIKVVPVIKEQMFIAYGYVDIYYTLEDGTEDKIYGTFKVDMDSPIFEEVRQKREAEELAKKQEEKKGKEAIELVLKKYSYEPLKQQVISEISRYSREGYSSDKFELIDVKNVMLSLGDFKYGKFWECQMEIQLKNDNIITKKLYVYNLEITKKILKSMGSKAGEKF